MQHTQIATAQYAQALSLIQFKGGDAVPFLQGYFTADTTALSHDGWQLTAICNLKGRVVANGWAQLSDSGVSWVVHHHIAEPVLHFLAPYLRFAKTKAEIDPGSIGFTPDLDFSLVDPGKPDATAEFYNLLFDRQIVLVDGDSSERFLPQMLGLVAAAAVSFDKGCYLGQEVVARAQHRGEVKRRITALPPDSDTDDPVVLRAPKGLLAVQRLS